MLGGVPAATLTTRVLIVPGMVVTDADIAPVIVAVGVAIVGASAVELKYALLCAVVFAGISASTPPVLLLVSVIVPRPLENLPSYTGEVDAHDGAVHKFSVIGTPACATDSLFCTSIDEPAATVAAIEVEVAPVVPNVPNVEVTMFPLVPVYVELLAVIAPAISPTVP